MTIHHGDCLEAMRDMPEASIDAIVTDPPYGLGFMGKKWDALPPGREWAEECLRVLKPGGHILAFGGSRTWHRLAVAIEDGGFEIRDSIAWLYGSGFPKHRAALKPAFEPIVMGRKPFKGSLTANEAIHGTGALDIDGCRIATDDDRSRPPRTANALYGGGSGTNLTASESNPAGRWPANVILDETQAETLDGQSGITKSTAGHRGLMGRHDAGSPKTRRLKENTDTVRGHSDSGGASRFFYVAKAPKSERPVVDGVAHPTVKPLSLMRHLIRLVTPEGGTVLDPFAGSGTTLEAATLEGFQSIGIERETAYLPLIRERLRGTTQYDKGGDLPHAGPTEVVNSGPTQKITTKI